MYQYCFAVVCFIFILLGCSKLEKPELNFPPTKTQQLPVISLNQDGDRMVVSWPKTITLRNEQGDFELHTELQGDFKADKVTVLLELINSAGATTDSTVTIAKETEGKFLVVLPIGNLDSASKKYRLIIKCNGQEHVQSGEVEIK